MVGFGGPVLVILEAVLESRRGSVFGVGFGHLRGCFWRPEWGWGLVLIN